MNQIVINQTALQIKEYNGKRVVTFKDIDAVHERPEGTARKRFNDNRKHFIEGEDYFNVQMSEKRTLEFDVPNRGLTLITESGYLMLVKSFTDDLAWTVQRQLVNAYFKTKKEESDINTRIKLSEQLYKLAKMSDISREQRINLIAKSAEVLTGEQVISPTTTTNAKNDLVLQFLDECCEMRTTYDGVTTKVLYDAFKIWCMQNAEKYMPKKSQFRESLCDFYGVEPTKEGRKKIQRIVNGNYYYPHTLTREAREKLERKKA